jgi:hypothetical protein
MKSIVRILWVTALFAAVLSRGEHAEGLASSARRAAEAHAGAKWSHWEKARTAPAGRGLLRSHSLEDIPRLDDFERPSWKEAPKGFRQSETARLELRLNLKKLKVDIVERLLAMLRAHPPLPKPKVDLKEAAEDVADAYLRAVDDFLRTHPGARPKLGSRNFIADAAGLQDEFNSPWCADWAGAMLKAMGEAFPGGHRVNEVFRFDWAQSHAKGLGVFPIQHNFVLVRPVGRPPQFPIEKATSSMTLLDPWRTILPKAYFPNPDGKWYENPTNDGVQ